MVKKKINISGRYRLRGERGIYQNLKYGPVGFNFYGELLEARLDGPDQVDLYINGCYAGKHQHLIRIACLSKEVHEAIVIKDNNKKSITSVGFFVDKSCEDFIATRGVIHSEYMKKMFEDIRTSVNYA